MATTPPPDDNERRRWQALCHNYIDLHKCASTRSAWERVLPRSDPIDFEGDRKDFHACAAKVYEKHLARLHFGEDNLDGVRKAHAILQEATSRADFDACDVSKL
jgi:hypothetical protein